MMTMKNIPRSNSDTSSLNIILDEPLFGAKRGEAARTIKTERMAGSGDSHDRGGGGGGASEGMDDYLKALKTQAEYNVYVSKQRRGENVEVM
jgi:hypothetical protein